MAQYIESDQIRLNPLPKSQGYGPKTFGHDRYRLWQRGQPGREAQYATETLAHDMEILFSGVLSSLAGSILVM